MLIRAREIFLERFARSHVVTCREHLPVPAEDYDANIIIRFCLEEGIVEFHQHPTILSVTCLWPIEHDANDLAIVETLMNFTGSPRMAVTVNGSVPAPTLRWRPAAAARSGWPSRRCPG